MSNTAPRDSTSQRPSIRILALDGGGVRGLSSLLLLRELMERLAVKRGITDHNSIRPSDVFDLIIGTGTGGISALFLGRLHMTVDEAIDEYMRMAGTAFKPSTRVARALRRSNALLNGRALERYIGDVARAFLSDRDASLQDSSSDPTVCRVAVLASISAHADAPPYVFRSYTTAQPASRFAIHEVARATVSTAGLFAAVALGTPPVQFIDAGLVGYNNPAEIALQEAAQIWPRMKIDCLVSLGTGLQKIVGVAGKWAKLIDASERIIQDCERVHNQMHSRCHSADLPYFRFNVTRGLGNIDIREWDQAGSRGKLAGITEGYTRHSEVIVSLDSCVQVVNGEILCEFSLPHMMVITNFCHVVTAPSAEGTNPGAGQVLEKCYEYAMIDSYCHAQEVSATSQSSS